MHDIKAIRDDAAAFTAGLKRRGFVAAESITSELLTLDKELRELQTRLQQAQARRNDASKQIGAAKAKKDEAQAQSLMSEVAGLKDEIQRAEEKERDLLADLTERLSILPNLPAPDVPQGAGEEENVEVPARRFGRAPGMNAPKDHVELGEKLGILDFKKAAQPPSCWTTTRANSATRSSCRRFWCVTRPCSAPDSCRNSKMSSSRR